MIYNAKESTINVLGMKFEYISLGSGDRPLIMIQGLNTRGIKGTALFFAYMYRIFAKEYTVYLFERRPLVREGLTVRDMASDIAAVMDVLGITNADIIGVSQGGMIAQYLAIDRPDLVRKLVLTVTLSRNNDTVIQVVNRWIKMVEMGEMKEFVRDMAEKMYSGAYMKRYRLFMPLLTKLQKPKDIERFVILAKACLTCNTYELLGQIKCPVFVLGGKHDKVVTGFASEEIAQKIGCKIHMYDNLGHAVYEEAGDFKKIIYDFLRE